MPTIAHAVESVPERGRLRTIQTCSNLEEAVGLATEIAEAGDVVLLAPGGTSYDEFRDFAERGERFKELVHAL